MFFLSHQLFHPRNILWDIDTDGVVGNFGDANAPAVFQPAELFELLDFFELALGEGWVLEQRVALEYVKTEMLPIFDVELLVGVANPGNGRAGEVQGEVVEIENGFDDVGVHHIGGVSNSGGHGGDLGGRFFEERGDGGVNGVGIDEGLVALHIDENIAGFVRGHFGNAFRSGAVIGTGKARLSAKGGDGVHNPLVIRGYQDFVYGKSLFSPVINVLDHGLPGEGDQGLAREPSRSEACGNDDDDFRIRHERNTPQG